MAPLDGSLAVHSHVYSCAAPRALGETQVRNLPGADNGGDDALHPSALPLKNITVWTGPPTQQRTLGIHNVDSGTLGRNGAGRGLC